MKNMPLGEELENLWNYPLADMKTKNFYTLIANKFNKKFHLWHLIRCIISIMNCECGLVLYTIKRRHGITCIHILNIPPKIHKVGFKQKLISLIIFIILKHFLYGPFWHSALKLDTVCFVCYSAVINYSSIYLEALRVGTVTDYLPTSVSSWVTCGRITSGFVRLIIIFVFII